MKITLTDILLAAVISIMMLQQYCRKEEVIIPPLPPNIVVNVYDTVPHVINVSAPTIRNEVQQAIPVKVDTAAIIRDYYTTREYTDLKSDSVLENKYDFTIGGNRLQSFKHSYKLLRPVTTTITSPPLIIYPKSFYLEAFGGNKSLGAGLLYVDKKNVYGIGYDALNQSAVVRVGIKLFGK